MTVLNQVRGPKGEPGEPGETGKTGGIGGRGAPSGFPYVYKKSFGEPMVVTFALDNAYIGEASVLRIDVSAYGNSIWVEEWSQSTTEGNYGYIYMTGELSGQVIEMVLKVVGPVTNHGSWCEVPISWVGGESELVENQQMGVAFARTGDQGSGGGGGKRTVAGRVELSGEPAEGSTGFTSVQTGEETAEYEIELTEALAAPGVMLVTPINGTAVIPVVQPVVEGKQKFVVHLFNSGAIPTPQPSPFFFEIVEL